MKTLYILIKRLTFILLLFITFSCEKEGDSYNISTETVFPNLTYESKVVIEVGGSFTPSVIAKEGDNTIDASIEGSVDNTTPGVYDINYSATNSDGYSKSETQLVFVYDPSVVPVDVSGTIHDVNRTARKGVISLVEGTTNIFYCTDMAYSGTFPLYFEMDSTQMNVIPQPFVFGVTEVEASYDPEDKTFYVKIVDNGYDYTFEYE